MSDIEYNKSHSLINETLREGGDVYSSGSSLAPHSHRLKQINNEINIIMALEEIRVHGFIIANYQIAELKRIEFDELHREVLRLDDIGKVMKCMQEVQSVDQQKKLLQQQIESLQGFYEKLKTAIKNIDDRISYIGKLMEDSKIRIARIESQINIVSQEYRTLIEGRFEKDILGKVFSEEVFHFSDGREVKFTMEDIKEAGMEIAKEMSSDENNIIGDVIEIKLNALVKKKLGMDSKEELGTDPLFLEESREFYKRIEKHIAVQPILDKGEERSELTVKAFVEKNYYRNLEEAHKIHLKAKDNLTQLKDLTSEALTTQKSNPAVTSQLVNSGDSYLNDIMKSCERITSGMSFDFGDPEPTPVPSRMRV